MAMSKWYKSYYEIKRNLKLLHDSLKKDYDAYVKEYGKEAADRYFDWDAHCCSDFAVDGGECFICGRILSGSPLSGDDEYDDWYLGYYSDHPDEYLQELYC